MDKPATQQTEQVMADLLFSAIEDKLLQQGPLSWSEFGLPVDAIISVKLAGMDKVVVTTTKGATWTIRLEATRED